MRYFLTVCVLLLCSVCYGQPKAVIVGPEVADPGNLVVLRTEGTVGTGHTWKVIPESATGFFLPVEDSGGNQVGIFACNQQGLFTFVLAVAEDGKVSMAVHTLLQGEKPPEPDPKPDPDEPDPPDPDPIPPGPSGLRVLIIEETADRSSLPESQLSALTGTKLRKWLNDNTAREDDLPEWRIWDDDFTEEQLRFSSDVWRKAYKDAKERSNGVRPWIYASNGKTGISAPMPKTLEETVELLEKYK